MHLNLELKFLMLLVFMNVSIYANGQIDLEVIMDKTLELREKSLNKEALMAKIEEEKANRYVLVDKHLNRWELKEVVNYKIATMYADLNELDSAFHYIAESKRKDEYENLLLYYPPSISMLKDKRFNVFLDSIYGHWKDKKNHLGISLSSDLRLLKELKAMEIIGKQLSNIVMNYRNGADYFNLRDSATDLQVKLNFYKTERYQEEIKNNGFPKKSISGMYITKDFIMHLKTYSVETLLENISTLENLALEGEIGQITIPELVDETLVASGKKQKYGTQLLYLIHSKKYVPFPIEDPENVEERRKLIGIEYTIEEAIKSKGGIYWK